MNSEYFSPYLGDDIVTIHSENNIFFDLYAVVEQEIENSLEQASVNCDRLSILVNKEPPQKKQSARM